MCFLHRVDIGYICNKYNRLKEGKMLLREGKNAFQILILYIPLDSMET